MFLCVLDSHPPFYCTRLLLVFIQLFFVLLVGIPYCYLFFLNLGKCKFPYFLTDYLVDEGTECNTTSDLLLERNRELSIVDLLVPSLVLLIALLQKLQVCPLEVVSDFFVW